MKKSIFKFSAVVMIIFIIASLAIFSGCAKKEEKEIKIGAILSLTGKAASYGEWAKKGITLAIEHLNVKGNSLRFSLIQEDSQGDAKVAVSAMNKLVSVDKVPSVIGFITSGEFLAVAPIAEEKKVVIITPVAGAPLSRGEGSYVFRTRESGVSQSKIVAEHVYNDLKIKKVSIIYENSANAVAYKDIFFETYRAYGGTIDQVLSYDEDTTDFRSLLMKIKTRPVEAIYMPGVGKIAGHILVQSKELGIKTKFFSSAGIEDPELLRIAGNTSEGLTYGAPAFSLESKEPSIKKFVEAYRKRFNEDPSVYAANAYDAMMLIAEAIKSGHATSEDIKTYLYGINNHSGASGVLTFEKNGEINKPVVLKKIMNGHFVSFGNES